MLEVSIQVKLVARPAISSLNITRRAMTSVMAENAAATYFAYFCLSPPMNRVTMAPIKGRTMSRVSSDISISDSSQDLCDHNEENGQHGDTNEHDGRVVLDVSGLDLAE